MNVTCASKNSACPVILSSSCVFYEGVSLINTGINTNDNLQLALQKIDDAIASNLDVNIYNSDGTLAGDRTLTLGSKTLKFAGSLYDTTFLANGTVQFGSLAGVGNRMVIANASGILSTQAIPVTSVSATAGTGISVSVSNPTTTPNITITNTLPDQIVSLIGAGTTSISGTYPNFTITSNDQYTGTVTNVSVATANGFAGSVATSTTTPVITLSTTITGIMKGDGTIVTAAIPNVDYLPVDSPVATTIFQLVGPGLTSYVPFINAIGTFASDVNDYQELYIQNINSGSDASADILAYNDVSSTSAYYIDMGINSSNYSSVDFPIFPANSGYVFTAGGSGVQPSHLYLGTATPNSDVVLFAGGPTISDIALRIAGATKNLIIGAGLGSDTGEKVQVTGNIKVDTGDIRVNGGGVYADSNMLGDPHQLTTKEYVDNQVSAGLHIHTPVRVEEGNPLTATYTQGGTTPTITDITLNKVLKSVGHGLLENDVIVFDISSNGLTGGLTYFVFQVLSPDTFTVSETVNGPEIDTLINGAGLTITSRANSGVGATLTNAGPQAALVVDTIPLSVGNRILVYNQPTGYFNGVYVVTDTGSPTTNWILTRASDANKYETQSPNGIGGGDYFFVQEGFSGAGESYVITNVGDFIIGTDTIVFTQFSATIPYTGIAPISVAGQNISLTGVVDATNGGTGTGIISTGDLLYGSAPNTWNRLPLGVAYKSLIVNASGTNVEWNAIPLNQTAAVSGQLSVANGGTGASTLTGVLVGDSTNPISGVTGTANQLLRRNASNTAYEFFTPTYVSDNIYNADGTLTGNRVVTLDSKQLVYRDSSATLTNYTYSVGVPTGVTQPTWPSSVIYEGQYIMTNNSPEPFNIRAWGRNQGGSLRSLWVNQSFADVTSESSGGSSIYNATYVTRRGSVLDTSTSTNSIMQGILSQIGHGYVGASSTTTQITSSQVIGVNSQLLSYVGNITSAFGYTTSLAQSHATSTQNTITTNYYAFYSSATIGTTSGPTALVTNYYGLHLSTPIVGATGTITNRWGVYAPDSAMKHYLNGTVLIGSATDSTLAKFQVTGAIQQTSVTSSMLKVDSNGVLVSAAAGTDYQAPITLTVTGDSGSATFIANTLNIPTYTLSGLGGVPTSRTLTINGVSYDLSADRSWTISTSSGTVTSVDMSVPTGFAISGNPITTSGTLALAFASGYSLPTNASQSNWDTAYTNRITSLTTTGSSGSATLISNTLNIPTYTLSGLGGVPTSRTLTINGTAFDLSADRSWSVGTVTSVSATAGTGISISGSPITSSGTLTITNTAPDQTVVLNNGTGISVTGTYPNFTISSTVSDTNIYNSDGTLSGNRTVTGGSNSLTFSGTSAFVVSSTGVTNEVAKLVGTEPYLLIQAAGASNSASLFLSPSTSAQNATIQNRTGGGLEFYTGTTPSLAMTIGSNLNVGIGGIASSTSGFELATTGKYAAFKNNLNGAISPSNNYGLYLGWNYTGGSGESNIIWGTGTGGNPYLTFSTWNGSSKVDRVIFQDTGLVNFTGYTSTTSFTGTVVGYLAFDASGNILTASAPGGSGTVTSIATSGPITGGTITTTGTIGITQATTSTDGYLSSTDWNTFNNKVSSNIYTANGTLSGNRTVATTSGYTLTFNPNVIINPTSSASISASSDGLYATNTISYAAGFSSGSLGYTYSAVNNYFNQTFEGSATFANSNVNASVVGINSLNFLNVGGSVTMTQASGIRSMAAALFQNQFIGTQSATISHLAGIQVLGNYRSSGSGTLTVTNGYGLLINDLNDYGAGFSFTNRWGIYQAGASDNNYFAGQVLIGSTAVAGDLLNVGAGTATVAPINVTASGAVLKSSASIGDIEVDANGQLYYTHNNLNRGAITSEQFLIQNATFTLGNNTNLQRVFNASANGALTVKGSTTYFFECYLIITSMSATSGNMGFSVLGAGTATVTSTTWFVHGLDATTQTTAANITGISSTAATQTGNILSAGTGTAAHAFIKGVIRVNAGGTIIPSVQQANASAAVVGVNSWFRIWPVGTNTVTTVGNWS